MALTIKHKDGIDYVYRDYQLVGPAQPRDLEWWAQQQANREQMITENKDGPRWEQVRDWLAEACPGRNWEAGVMPTGRNGNDLPD